MTTASHTFVRATNIPELLSGDPSVQKIIAVIYLLALIGLFALVVKKGARMVNASKKEYLTVPTDELCLRDI